MKNFLFLWSLIIVVLISACSEHDNSSKEGPKADVMIKLNFEGADMVGKTKAVTKSTAIPVTSWDNIKQVQFLLYNTATKKISFSAVVKPSASQKQFTYTDIPVGAYKLVAVANANSSSDAIVTSLDGGTSNVQWDMWNVRQKNATKLTMTHKAGEFPSFCKTKQTDAGNEAYVEPSEIFMGSTDVSVSAGTVAAATVSLKREVSLMRVRLNVQEGEHGVDNKNTVDYAKDASIMIFQLPKSMDIMAGNQGGVNTASEIKHVLSVSGTGTFKTANPTNGYNPKTILTDKFTMWNDVIVFPNNNGRADNANATGIASTNRQYFIVISASGKTGHVLADGTKLNSAQTVYWSGIIKEKFVPNTIREVNLTLRTGGTTEVPTQPTKNGDLTITVSQPEPWNTNIVESSIIL